MGVNTMQEEFKFLTKNFKEDEDFDDDEDDDNNDDDFGDEEES